METEIPEFSVRRVFRRVFRRVAGAVFRPWLALACVFGFLVFPAFVSAQEMVVKTLVLPPVKGMVRAELKYGAQPKDCAGILVLCPGFNRDGEFMLWEKGWREFARERRLLPVALHFVSEVEDLRAAARTGYYYPEKGSGKLLLDGLAKLTGGRELPIVLFGFSGGAQFAHRFVYLHPERVEAWAAYGFGWHDVPKPAREGEAPPPPGLFVCGTEDERLTSTRDAFLGALRAKWRVCWLGVPGSGHVMEPRALDRTREFLGAVLNAGKGSGKGEGKGSGKRAGEASGKGAAAGGGEGGGVWAEGEFANGLDGFILRQWFPNDTLRQTWNR